MRVLSVPAPSPFSGRTTNFALFDSPAELGAFASERCSRAGNMRDESQSAWYGREAASESVHRAKHGDLSRVARSEALLARFESFAFETARAYWIDDVTGGRANVQAYLAGLPLNMKRRVRHENAGAPLAIIVDLTTSASVDSGTIERRGSAILALVRVLSARRPVELWAGVSVGAGCDDEDCAAIYTRINAAPLDLSSACYAMNSAAFPRRLCYSIAQSLFRFDSAWPFDSSASISHMGAILAPAFAHMAEVLCIPAVHGRDNIASDPEGWIARKLTELAPIAMA